MATLKYKKIKRANYGWYYDYLTMEFDEKREHAIRDDYGLLVHRDDAETILLRSDGSLEPAENWLSCCTKLDLKFNKNNKKNSNNMYHFIVGFDHRDQLTSGKILKLILEYARKVLSGFNVLIAAHDGQHAHMVAHSTCELSSVNSYHKSGKTYEISHVSGNKLALTYIFTNFLKSELMSLCERNKLHQIDLFARSQRRVTDGEYALKKNGGTSDRDIIINAIEYATHNSSTTEEYFTLLKSKDITCSRRKNGITYHLGGSQYYFYESSLGSNFTSDKVAERLNTNLRKSSEFTTMHSSHETLRCEPEDEILGNNSSTLKLSLDDRIHAAIEKSSNGSSASQAHHRSSSHERI